MEAYLYNEISNQSDLEDSTTDWNEDNQSFNSQSDLEDDLDLSFNGQSEAEQANQSSPIPYMLFLYRKDMCRLKTSKLELSKSKLLLTQEMVAYSVNRIAEYSKEELMNIQRQMYFTCRLQIDMDHMEAKQKCHELEANLDLIGFEL